MLLNDLSFFIPASIASEINLEEGYFSKFTDLFQELAIAYTPLDLTIGFTSPGLYLTLKAAPGSYTLINVRDEEIRYVGSSSGSIFYGRNSFYSFEFITRDGRFVIYQVLKRLANLPSSCLVLDSVNVDWSATGGIASNALYTPREGRIVDVSFEGGTVVKDAATRELLTSSIRVKFQENLQTKLFR